MRKINVVLMRGLAGNVYSRGMDTLGSMLAKLQGVDYVTVEDYASWRSIRSRLERWRDPTVIGGHSFGANAATIIAASITKSIPLLISVDPSQHWSWLLLRSGPVQIKSNVSRAVNWYQPHGIIGRQTLYGKGVVNHRIEDASHTSIDDNEMVLSGAEAEVQRVIAAYNS